MRTFVKEEVDEKNMPPEGQTTIFEFTTDEEEQ